MVMKLMVEGKKETQREPKITGWGLAKVIT
jgi:hypothetical protein